MKKLLSKESGITMLMIVLMVVVLLVILLVVTFYAKNSIPMENFQKMKADIKEIEAKAQMYYMNNKALPIIISDSKSSVEGDFVNPNDEGDYFLVDTERLGVVPTYNTKYYINEGSHTVYADKIIEINGKRYSRFKDDFDLLAEKPNNIPKWEEVCFDDPSDPNMFLFGDKDDPGAITGITDKAIADNEGAHFQDLIIPAYKADGKTPITSIKGGAFSGIHVNRDFKVPNTIQYIGPNVFSGTYLMNLYLDGQTIDIDAFKGCTNLLCIIIGPSTTLPDATKPEDGVFYNIPGLTYAAIDTVLIGKYAFAGNTSLNNVWLTNKIQEIPEGCFMKSGCGKMYKSDALGEVTSKEHLIGNFEKIQGLPSMLNVIAKRAFYYCGGMNIDTLNTIPEDLERIEEEAFRGQWQTIWGNITFNKNLKYIGANAFQNQGLSTVTFTGDTEYEANAFSGGTTIKNK